MRIVNHTGRDAMQLYLANAGAPLGANRLVRPLADGAALLQRAGPGASCLVDLRLVLADGEEEVRRGHDVCAWPAIVLGNAPPRPAPGGGAPRPPASPERRGPSTKHT
ncbi:hypothetical protein JYK14_20830 [Siccirubricoccus sp. KC 17139]|uniref:Uncharacterized protein n=1 Tax=Siccirubricoccus soli TaxID=2899147 RepID=A0ABT1DBK6_9PROT|nr:hypothetical protein [Siccirubricoccus soli]MCO6418585.1 hypothetical protein [Siccirubricoccus soli]MCP2684720.1 hypothetical protein [Siccirubricoccus soli]